MEEYISKSWKNEKYYLCYSYGQNNRKRWDSGDFVSTGFLAVQTWTPLFSL